MEREPREKQPTRTFGELLRAWRTEEERKLSGPHATTIPKSADEAIRNLKIIGRLEVASGKKGFADLVIPRHLENTLRHDMSWISPRWRNQEDPEILVEIEEFLEKVKSRAVR
jgi:hypothetical protein